jgi:hypothetical protein
MGGPMMGPGMGGPSPYGVDPITGMPFSDKSKVVAGLLNIFLFGAGRLYTGHIGIGIAQILTTVFSATRREPAAEKCPSPGVKICEGASPFARVSSSE